MKLRISLIFLIICSFALISSENAYAQRTNTDSLTQARQRILDSTRAAQKHYLDSVRVARKHYLDSIKIVRQHRTDSLAALREYRESRRYKDSVADARQARVDSIQAVRKAHFDSIKLARQRVTDSTIAARKAITDAIQARQKRRSDSLAAIRKYRESKRYQDSLALARRERLDSIKAVRKAYNDSVALARKLVNDSLIADRKAQFDSIAAVRNKYLDSIKAVRQVRTDSLAKVKEKRKKSTEARVEEREKKQQLALELKIKKKREAWTNEKMLKKRWSMPRQVIQNTFTRYNYYFNTDRKMDEALDNMQRVRKENFDSTLALFPFDPDRDSATLAADMDSIIQKASVGIQIHDPRTKWGDDLYLLMGQAYYYKGKYEDAATTFKYIVHLSNQNKKKTTGSSRSERVTTQKKGTAGPSVVESDNNGVLDFIKHRSVHNEGLLWLARTYTEANQPENAESVIDLLETDPNLPESLKGRMAIEKAYVKLTEGDHKSATEQLTIVTNDKHLPDWIRQRAAYLNGQLLYERGDYTASANSFNRVLDLQPKIDMDFYARKNMAYSLMMAGGNQEEVVASLKRVLKDGKYSAYYEQVYYVIGRLAASSGKHEDALEYLQQSISSPKSTKKQKALSYATMGNVYYNMHKYVLAKNAYDSAAAMAVSNDDEIVLAKRRASALTELVGPLSIIHNQDSLLALAAMTEKEQLSAVRRHIKHLRDLKDDSTFRAENQGLNVAKQQENVVDAGGGSSGFGNWYFANPMLMQQGQNEFKRKWGSRTLTDNWRRSASNSFVNNTKNNEGPDVDNGPELDEDGLPTEESLLAYIPNGIDKKEDAQKRIRRAYVDASGAYIQLLEDYPEAIHSLDTLNKRFPAHEHKAEELYLRYLASLRQNKLPEAQSHASQLQSKYPDTRWAKLVHTIDDKEPVATTNVSAADYYDETYGLLLQRQYANVLQRVTTGQKLYTDPKYVNRFRIIEAIAFVGVNDFDRADTLVSEFIAKNPSDSLRRWADAVKDYIKKNRVNAPAPPTGNTAIFASNTTAPGTKTPDAAASPDEVKKDTAAAAPELPIVTPPAAPPASFSYKPQEEHYVIFSVRNMEQRAMGVKAAMTDFNTFRFGSLKLDTKSEVLAPDQALIVTRKFQNAALAKIYITSLRKTEQVFREYKSEEYQIFMVSANNYLKIQADKTIKPYLNFYKDKYK